MSNSEGMSSNTIKLYRTGEHKCSYLDNRKSRTLFLDPEVDFNLGLYEELTQSGFRRSGKHLYRPDCQRCNACIPARIPVNMFQKTSRYQRVSKKNRHLRLEVTTSEYRDQDYLLFEQYIAERHSDGDMYPATKHGYEDFLALNRENSLHIRFFLDEKLICVAVTDRLITGLSAIYTYFDPSLNSRSLGVFSILTQIEFCKKWNLPYLYLGYWVPGCQKMNYKTQYQPIELLIDGTWQSVIHD